MFYVYLYSDVKGPFYVGKGSGKRDQSHFRESRKRSNRTPFYGHLRKLMSANELIRITRVQSDLTEEEAFAVEKELIAKIGRKCVGTGPLLNLREGGNGVRATKPRSSKPKSASHRARISKAMTGNQPGNSRRCSVGDKVYPSRGALARELGFGKAGCRHPNFRYV